jgi:putative FmdB family regulatory protein
MPIFDYKCPTCEKVAEDVLVNYADDIIECEECEEQMDKLPSTFGIVMGDTWVSKIENKYGKDGSPYRDEAGNKRPGVDDSLPHVAGPRTKAKWRKATQEINKLKEKGED